MTQQLAIHHDAPSSNPRYADAFVIFSVTVLSLAIGAWFLLRLELALWSGTVAALGVYAALLSLHLMLRRSLVGGGERAERLPAGEWAEWRAQRGAPHGLHAGAEAGAAADAPISPEEEAARWAEAARADARQPGGDLPEAGPAGPFNFRPSREPSLGYAAPPAPQPPAPAEPPRAAGGGGVSQSDLSVEQVQDLIKRLADELNGAAGGNREARPAPANETEAMIGRSVAALQAMTRSLQPPAAEPAAGGPGGGIASWWPTSEPRPAAPPPLDPQLERIAEAVAAGRMEVLLEPIHALPESRPRHFEVSMRLLTADGTALDQAELGRAAHGSALMPQIDAARMVRAARVARRLAERGRQGSVLTSMASESLTDDAFVDLAAAEAWTGGMGLLLSFTQSEARAFAPGHAQALATLSAAGLRFALEDVTDLDMDFAALKLMGFEFVELDAPVFLDGLPYAGGRVPAADICRHLAGFGLALIVGRIEDEWLLKRIQDLGVLFGKGAVFGPPRLVKEEVVAGPSAA
jgi:cyclic-di-GMP phosphodiesterase TipF (flagellum assembly factor)